MGRGGKFVATNENHKHNLISAILKKTNKKTTFKEAYREHQITKTTLHRWIKKVEKVGFAAVKKEILLAPTRFDLEDLQLVRKDRFQCRACRKQSHKKMQPLGESLLEEVFTNVTQIQIQANDNRPKFICEDCVKELESIAKFKKMCEESDQFYTLKEKETYDEFSIDFNQKQEVKSDDEVFAEPLECPINLKPELEEDNKDLITLFPEHVPDSSPPSPPQPLIKKSKNAPISDETIFCHDCGGTRHYSTRGFFLKHWNLVHLVNENPAECNSCTATFQNNWHLEIHYLNEHRIYFCPTCQRQELWNKGLASNRDRHRKHKTYCNGAIDKCSCKYCGKLFVTLCKLKQHELQCSKSELCATCGMEVPLIKMRFHMKKHMPKQKERLSCMYCSKEFLSRDSWRDHQRGHVLGKRFFCDICGKGEAHKYMLGMHMRNVHCRKKRPKKVCTLCGIAVTSLNSHMRTHTNERRFICPVEGCGATFRERCTLQKHSYSHSKTRPYNCIHCSTGYYQTEYLRGHYQRAHGLKFGKGKVPFNKM